MQFLVLGMCFLPCEIARCKIIAAKSHLWSIDKNDIFEITVQRVIQILTHVFHSTTLQSLVVSLFIFCRTVSD